jgi:formylglycine-generating enzyme required for sulfatase activity
MDEEIKRIREYVFEKYIEGTHAGPELDDAAALAKLREHHRTHPVSVDGETYYLGILFFELAFSDPAHEKEFLARAKFILEEWRKRSGEAWDVVDDRVDDATSALDDLPADERERLLAAARDEFTAAEAAATAAVAKEERAGPVIEDGMAFVPAGQFLSGPQKTPRETKAYWIDIHPVTNAEYKRFCEVTGYRAPKYWTEGRFREPGAPVVGISWYDAYKYAAWAGKSLPTKDQWEKAARGKNGRIYPWGDEFDASKACFGQPEESEHIDPVGQHPDAASEWGVQDMCGFVWEWTDSPDPSDSEQKVVCGGSWCDPESFLRCDEHLAAYPKDKYDNIGFRCIRLAKE